MALNVAGAAGLLAAAKAVVGFSSGSIAVLSSALDSAGDMLASFVNFVFLTIAAKPPDEDHPFGHGKAEHLAALFQGALLFSGSLYLGARAVHRIADPEPLDASIVAVAAMVGSMIATFAITSYLKRNAVREESSALASDALHYSSDFVANAATIIALIVVRYSGNPVYDSILGITVAAWIGWNSIYLIWNAGNDLMDRSLPESELAAVMRSIEESDPEVVDFADLRTRRAAGVRFIEFELRIDRRVSFDRAHELTEMVKARIRSAFPRVVITVHAEPVDR